MDSARHIRRTLGSVRLPADQEITMKTRFALAAAVLAIVGTTLVAQQPAAPPAAAPAAPQQPGGRGGGRGQGGGIQASPFTTPPIRIFIYAGLKTHGEGQHDYPQ